LAIVADSPTKRTWGGAKIRLSSQTVPRSTSSTKCTSSKIAKSVSAKRAGSSNTALRKISVVMMTIGASGRA
jgi:hypothetical protein